MLARANAQTSEPDPWADAGAARTTPKEQKEYCSAERAGCFDNTCRQITLSADTALNDAPPTATDTSAAPAEPAQPASPDASASTSTSNRPSGPSIPAFFAGVGAAVYPGAPLNLGQQTAIDDDFIVHFDAFVFTLEGASIGFTRFLVADDRSTYLNNLDLARARAALFVWHGVGAGAHAALLEPKAGALSAEAGGTLFAATRLGFIAPMIVADLGYSLASKSAVGRVEGRAIWEPLTCFALYARGGVDGIFQPTLHPFVEAGVGFDVDDLDKEACFKNGTVTVDN